MGWTVSKLLTSPGIISTKLNHFLPLTVMSTETMSFGPVLYVFPPAAGRKVKRVERARSTSTVHRK